MKQNHSHINKATMTAFVLWTKNS